jgi:hypothetical protein
MKYLPIYKADIVTRHRIIVDDDDFAFLSQWRWHMDDMGYPCRYQHHKRIRLHTVLLNAGRGFVTDHDNGNKLDNRRQNLRLATRAQNNRNARVSKSAGRDYKGLEQTPTGRWVARIHAEGRRWFLGTFDDILEAAAVYNQAALCFHGYFACLIEVDPI